MKINLGKGLLRLYFVLWILWIFAMLVFYHKALAPHVGITYWTNESYNARDKQRCEAQFAPLEDCRIYDISLPDIVTDKQIEEAPKDFFDLCIVIPFILLFIFTVIYMALKWIFKGFKK
jgi:hypothetical protein